VHTKASGLRVWSPPRGLAACRVTSRSKPAVLLQRGSPGRQPPPPRLCRTDHDQLQRLHARHVWRPTALDGVVPKQLLQSRDSPGQRTRRRRVCCCSLLQRVWSRWLEHLHQAVVARQCLCSAQGQLELLAAQGAHNREPASAAAVLAGGGRLQVEGTLPTDGVPRRPLVALQAEGALGQLW
jgi:hypothetical protein